MPSLSALLQKLPLNDDLFEADSEADSDWQSDAKGDLSPKKKKKKSKEREDKNHDELKKKKSKSVKGKERPGLERENSSDSLASDSKPKKRTSEVKEDAKDSKKQRREDSKDSSKKKEWKDTKKKTKEEFRENKHFQKDKSSALHLDAEPSTPDDSLFRGADNETVDLNSDSSDEKHMIYCGKDQAEGENVPRLPAVEKQLDSSSSTDDSSEVKVKRKKKKHKRAEDSEVSRKVDTKEKHLEKKSMHKKQKPPEKTKFAAELETKRPLTPAPVQKGSKLSTDERGRKSTDSVGEVSNHMKQKNKEAKSGQTHARDMLLQKSAISDGKDKSINWRSDDEKTKERHSVGESLFEKFILDSDCSKGGSTVSKKGLSRNDLNAEDISKDKSTLSKVTPVLL